MPNEIPISGAGSAGVLLPVEQGEILTNGVLQENGALQIAGDAKTTGKRKSTFPIWLGKPTAGPVGEGGRKPVTGAKFGSTELHVKKFASIVLFTDEQIEDVQSGDLNVLVDSGVREALADSIDAHIVGKDEGAPLVGGSVFDTSLVSTAAAPIEVDLSAPDGLQRAVSKGMGVLEGNGYGNPANMGLLLGHGFQQAIRDARDAENGAHRPLYGSNDPLYGLARSLSTNLNGTAAAPAADNVVGFVVHRPNIHVRLRTDVRVKVDASATIELPNGESVNLFQDNMTAVRYELRLGVMAHDVDRAIVPIVNRQGA